MTKLGVKSSVRFYDRRTVSWRYVDAYCWKVNFTDDLTTEFQVMKSDFTEDKALAEVKFYSDQVARMPTYLRTKLITFSIMSGNKPYGGGNNNILVHTGQTVSYVNSGILLETLMHEASHTSLDLTLANDAGWNAAQAADNGNFLSIYGRDHPLREDLAETFLVWWAVRHSCTTKLTTA